MAGLLARKQTRHFEILAGLATDPRLPAIYLLDSIVYAAATLRSRVKNPQARNYQLDFVTPGINP